VQSWGKLLLTYIKYRGWTWNEEQKEQPPHLENQMESGKQTDLKSSTTQI
jgi:hypothetical protein